MTQGRLQDGKSCLYMAFSFFFTLIHDFESLAVCGMNRQPFDRSAVLCVARMCQMRAACGDAIASSEHEYDGVLFTRPDVMYETDLMIPTEWPTQKTIAIPFPSGYRCSDGNVSINGPIEPQSMERLRYNFRCVQPTRYSA